MGPRWVYAQSMKPFCFVLMPFGQKPDSTGRIIDFDAVYNDLIKPAIEAADLDPIRADEELGGGIIHKPMFERLLLCEYAVADLTTANANVFYELGVRHATRPHTTQLIFAEDSRIPFDVHMMRALPYKLNEDGVPAQPEQTGKILTDYLVSARKSKTDSPLFQLDLLQNVPDDIVAREKTDIFRDIVEYAQGVKNDLAKARSDKSVEAIDNVRAKLPRMADVEPGILIDLLLSYRALSAWEKMIELVEEMPPEVARTVLVREQFGFALNRASRRDDAEAVLNELVRERGPSSETLGILGRVYKDRWQEARDAGNEALARGFLKKAIDTYTAGFEADSRDYYPGINALTLMDLCDPPDDRRHDLGPVVAFALDQRLRSDKADYWDHATQLELAVLRDEQAKASDALDASLTAVREKWEPETTARNIALIREARARRGEDVGWIEEIESALTNAAG